MKFTPRSTARRSTDFAASGSGGSPQMPFPVMRIAPKPSRLTVRSPPTSIVPAAPAVESAIRILSGAERGGEARGSKPPSCNAPLTKNAGVPGTPLAVPERRSDSMRRATASDVKSAANCTTSRPSAAAWSRRSSGRSCCWCSNNRSCIAQNRPCRSAASAAAAAPNAYAVRLRQRELAEHERELVTEVFLDPLHVPVRLTAVGALEVAVFHELQRRVGASAQVVGIGNAHRPDVGHGGPSDRDRPLCCSHRGRPGHFRRAPRLTCRGRPTRPRR